MPAPDHEPAVGVSARARRGGAPSIVNGAMTQTLASFLTGANGAFIAELHERWLADPNSVDASWQAVFDGLAEEAAALGGETNGQFAHMLGRCNADAQRFDQLARFHLRPRHGRSGWQHRGCSCHRALLLTIKFLARPPKA